jgi:hydroxymethylpyrimidine/phosphomethylpyrimidine kinase
MSQLPVVLSFGASDPTGATGMQADQLAIASMGCHPASVITAFAADDSAAVAVLAIDAEAIEAQARSVLNNMAVAAIKIGTIGAVDQVQPIASVLADFDSVPVVLDANCAQLMDDGDDELADAVRELLISQATVVSVSLARAQRLVAQSEREDERHLPLTAEACARELVGWGAEYVLLTDAEPGSPASVHALYDESGLLRSDNLPRLEAATRIVGAEDTLSAALAGLLAQGLDMAEAAQEAAQYTAAALAHAFHAGIGIAIPDRLFWAGDDDEDEGSDVN